MVLCNLPMDFELGVLIHEGLTKFSSYRSSVGPARQPHACHGEDQSAAQESGGRAHLPFSGGTAGFSLVVLPRRTHKWFSKLAWHARARESFTRELSIPASRGELSSKELRTHAIAGTVVREEAEWSRWRHHWTTAGEGDGR